MKFRKSILIFFGLVTFTLLTSCSPWAVIGQDSNNQWMTLDSGHTIGQTFVVDYSGLQAVILLLAPQSPGNGILTLHLRSSPDSSLDVTTVKLPINEIKIARSYRFDFSAIKNSRNQYYYAFLSMGSDGSIQVGSGPADTYQNGSAYLNHTPVEAQLTFSLEYDRTRMIIGLLQQVLRWVIICITGTLILTIPGWAVMSIFWQNWQNLEWTIRLPLSIGVSMAFYTLFVLFTYLIHVQLGIWYAWIPITSGLLIIFLKNNQIENAISNIRNLLHGNLNKKIRIKSSFGSDICLIIILGLIIISRFWAMRGLDEPMWNDSLHHSEITQLILDNQGLFTSWLPYAPYQTFSMHYGFPLASALLGWITGFNSGQAVLYMGQLLNIFACLALYPIAIKLTRGNKLSGIIVVLTAGLLSPMPAFYINWGRYAQLAGQVIFPIVMWMVWEVVDSSSKHQGTHQWYKMPWSEIIITAGTVAGMILFEFRMIFIITTYVIALSIGQFIKYFKFDLQKWLGELWSIFLIGFISIILFLPWGIRLQQSNLINYSSLASGVNNLLNLIQQDYLTWRNVFTYIPLGIIILGTLGWIWAVIKRNWSVVSVGIWVVLMASLYSLIILHIPWVQYVQSFAVIISLYIPAGLLMGYLASEVSPWLNRHKYSVVIYLVLIFIGLLGIWNQRNISTPDNYSLVTRPDINAMLWIQKETPINSLFLVEGTHENWVSNIIGTDAGWWIPLLAHRENTIPPQYAISNEVPIVEDYSRKLIDLEANLEKTRLNSEAGVRLLCQYGIDHIYIGQKQGTVGNKNTPLFSPYELSNNPVFRLIYHQDRVYIYSVVGACGQ